MAYGIVGTLNKTTIYLPDELHRSLQAAARRTGKSQAHLIREAVEGFLEEDDRPRLRSIGVGEDAELDARHAKEWLREHWWADDHD